MNLDELRGDRPDLDCEPEQAGDIPPNLQLDETMGCPVRVKVAEFGVSLRGWLRSSDIGCGFEDAGPVRPEDCFPVPSLNVVRGGASASPAGREFEIAYVDAESVARRLALIDAWSVPFEECMPVRGFPSYKGSAIMSAAGGRPRADPLSGMNRGWNGIG